MRVLVACEFSGTIRDAFAARGHDAWSCDFHPTDKPGKHFQTDVLHVLDQHWDLLIAHPPCTRLCNSGVRWLDERNLWGELEDAAAFFNLFLNSPINKVCIENPIPHGHALKFIGRDYDQMIQPWMFGHPESKATCLWLKNLPPLMSTIIEPDRQGKLWRLPPSEERSKLRSTTYQGIADAMATQWG